MIDQVMNEINNHFPRTLDAGKYTINGDTLTGALVANYQAGQYVYIIGSILNDGVYKITEVAPGEITLDTTLADEVGEFAVWGLAIPNAFLKIVEDIEAYQAKGPSDGVASESIGRYSVSYKNGGGWRDIFKGRLDVYRCIYDTTKRPRECRGWQNRMCL